MKRLIGIAVSSGGIMGTVTPELAGRAAGNGLLVATKTT